VGTVSFFGKLGGVGFIDLAQKGMVPEDKVYVHWRAIKSSDRCPFLIKDQQVEFSLTKWIGKGKDGEEVSLRAHDVTLPGGLEVNLQDEADREQKVFIGGQTMRYTGSMKFYTAKSGYGFINIDPGFPPQEGQEIPADFAWIVPR